jgi:hypothetical protein
VDGTLPGIGNKCKGAAMESRNKPMGVLVGLGCVFLIFFGMLAFTIFALKA